MILGIRCITMIEIVWIKDQDWSPFLIKGNKLNEINSKPNWLKKKYFCPFHIINYIILVQNINEVTIAESCYINKSIQININQNKKKLIETQIHNYLFTFFIYLWISLIVFSFFSHILILFVLYSFIPVIWTSFPKSVQQISN